MSKKRVPEAKLSGESINVFGKTLYRVNCPECAGPQWHGQGMTSCIYCDAEYVVHAFRVVEGKKEEEA